MIYLKSHGFKFSRPEANFVFDVSYFKNPWRESEIKEETNPEERTKKIIEFIKKQEGSQEMVDRICSVVILVYLLHPDENIKVALCCSAGEYRSPVMVQLLAEKLIKANVPCSIEQSPDSKL